MPIKSAQLQIRVTPEQKRTLKRLARESATEMSAWILDRVLPPEGVRFQELAAVLAESETKSFALAELEDFLRALPGGAFVRATSEAPRARIDPATLNHLAGAIDRAAVKRGVAPPTWVGRVPAFTTPTFGSRLKSARLHLLTNSPVAMRRRNVFVDASIDERV
ncbi:MAG: hypothetical protein ACR2GJ_10090 [Gemmatimonadaceae bacterium]